MLGDMQARDYANREALEVAITEKTTEPKVETITGTVEELAALRLEHGMSVWGMAVVATDYVAPERHEKPQRGELHVFSMNLRKEDNKN